MDRHWPLINHQISQEAVPWQPNITVPSPLFCKDKHRLLVSPILFYSTRTLLVLVIRLGVRKVQPEHYIVVTICKTTQWGIQHRLHLLHLLQLHDRPLGGGDAYLDSLKCQQGGWYEYKLLMLVNVSHGFQGLFMTAAIEKNFPQPHKKCIDITKC